MIGFDIDMSIVICLVFHCHPPTWQVLGPLLSGIQDKQHHGMRKFSGEVGKTLRVRKGFRLMMTFLTTPSLSWLGRLVFVITIFIHPAATMTCIMQVFRMSFHKVLGFTAKMCLVLEVANEARQYRIVGLYDQLFGEAAGSLFATGSTRNRRV